MKRLRHRQCMQAHHHTIANELIGSHGGYRGEIFDSIRHGVGAAKTKQKNQDGPGLKDVVHDEMLCELIQCLEISIKRMQDC